MVVLGVPGQLHAQRSRASLPHAIQPGFRGAVTPRFRFGVNPGVIRRFDRFEDRFENRFNRFFFVPGFNRGFFDPRFNRAFSPGFNMGFSPASFRSF
jgi:hypothetical protein